MHNLDFYLYNRPRSNVNMPIESPYNFLYDEKDISAISVIMYNLFSIEMCMTLT